MKRKGQVCAAPDVARILHEVENGDAETRTRAVRSLCPCRNGWGPFETQIVLLSRLTKDPCPAVRAAALHLFEDAAEMETEGLTTSPREATNDMLRTRRASRLRALEEDLQIRIAEREKSRRHGRG